MNNAGRTQVGWLLTRLCRLAIIVLLGFAGWETVRTLRLLAQADPGPLVVDMAPMDDLFAPVTLLQNTPPDAEWIFTDSPLTTTSFQGSLPEVTAWLNRTPLAGIDSALQNPPTAEEMAALTARISLIANQRMDTLLRVLPLLPIQWSQQGAWRTGQLAHPDFAGVVHLLQTPMGERLVDLKVAVLMGHERWLLLQPILGRPDSSVMAAETFLPLARGGKVMVVCRQGRTGQRLRECVVYPVDIGPAALTRCWQQAGWQVVSGQSPSEGLWVARCHKGDKQLLACLLANHGSRLLLIGIPPAFPKP